MLDLEKRQKEYEDTTRIAREDPVILRVDGRAFHTFTRGTQKPYDNSISYAMAYATMECARNMQGVRLAYTQSDETSFLLQATGEDNGWFGFRVQKIVSITAAMFTYYFNDRYDSNVGAFFDCRAFSCPLEDVANNFYWRFLDCKRNSVQAMAHAYLSASKTKHKNVAALKEELKNHGQDWDAMNPVFKYGRFFYRFPHFLATSREVNYDMINEMAGIQ